MTSLIQEEHHNDARFDDIDASIQEGRWDDAVNVLDGILSSSSSSSSSSESAAAESTSTSVFDAMCIRLSIEAMLDGGSKMIKDMGRNLASLAMDPALQAEGSEREALADYVLGTTAMAQGKTSSAEERFRSALQKDSCCSLARLGIAACRFRAKEWRACFTELKNLLAELGSLAPPVVRVGMGVCAFRLGQFDHAQKCLDTALNVNPEDTTALLALFALHSHCRRMKDAAGVIKRLYEIWPAAVSLQKLTDVFYFRAAAEGKVAEQQELLLERIEQGRESAAAAGQTELVAYSDFQRGRVLQSLGRFTEASDLLTAASKAAPELAAAKVHLAEVKYNLKDVAHEGAQDARELVNNLRAQLPHDIRSLTMASVLKSILHEHSGAIQLSKLLTDAVAVGDPMAWSVSAWTNRSDIETYTAHLNQHRALADEHGQTCDPVVDANIAAVGNDTERLVKVAKEQYNLDLASKDWHNKPNSIDANMIPVIYNYALVLERRATAGDENNKTDTAAARSLYIALIRQYPDLSEPYFRLVAMAVKQSRLAEAMSWTETLLSIRDDEAAFITCATLLAGPGGKSNAKGRTHALEIAKKAQKVFGDKPSVLLLIGAIYLQELSQTLTLAHLRSVDPLKKVKVITLIQQTAATYKKVLAQQPDNVLAAHGLACCSATLGNYKHSLPLFHSIAETPANADAPQKSVRDHLFCTLVNTGAWRQAIDEAKKSFNSETKWYNRVALARCYSNMNRFEEALTILETVARETDPNGKNMEIGYHTAVTQIASVYYVLSVSTEESIERVEVLKQRVTSAKEWVETIGRQMSAQGDVAKEKMKFLKTRLQPELIETVLRNLESLRHNAVLNAAQEAPSQAQWQSASSAWVQQKEAEQLQKEAIERAKTQELLAQAEKMMEATRQIYEGIGAEDNAADANAEGGDGGAYDIGWDDAVAAAAGEAGGADGEDGSAVAAAAGVDIDTSELNMLMEAAGEGELPQQQEEQQTTNNNKRAREDDEEEDEERELLGGTGTAASPSSAETLPPPSLPEHVSPPDVEANSVVNVAFPFETQASDSNIGTRASTTELTSSQQPQATQSTATPATAFPETMLVDASLPTQESKEEGNE